jgi:hypothetical protein
MKSDGNLRKALKRGQRALETSSGIFSGSVSCVVVPTLLAPDLRDLPGSHTEPAPWCFITAGPSGVGWLEVGRAG